MKTFDSYFYKKCLEFYLYMIIKSDNLVRKSDELLKSRLISRLKVHPELK